MASACLLNQQNCGDGVAAFPSVQAVIVGITMLTTCRMYGWFSSGHHACIPVGVVHHCKLSLLVAGLRGVRMLAQSSIQGWSSVDMYDSGHTSIAWAEPQTRVWFEGASE